MNSGYEPVIGLEIHARLLTKSKIFCSCENSFGGAPNTRTCPVCLGLPGCLPVLNKEVVRLAIKTGLALNSNIAQFTKFDRKNYFYPDLPKAYQISQYDMPICEGGYLDVPLNDGIKRVNLTRIHLEEDAGKLLHSTDDFVRASRSFVDYNRCGTPLIEIVTEPELNTPEETYTFLTELKKILLYLEVCDCNMEEGSLKCDANISVRLNGEIKLGTKAELKNMNSFKNIKTGLSYEIERQINAIKNGEKIVQETRLWNAQKNITESMRSKEEAHDYRYFPEPDLTPVIITKEEINEIRETLPELPLARFNRFKNEYSISEQDARELLTDRGLADFFENVAKSVASPKSAANWILVEMSSYVNDYNVLNIKDIPIKPEYLSELITLIDKGIISGKIAKDVFKIMWETPQNPSEIIRSKGLVQVTDTESIDTWVQEVIRENPKEVESYKSGKTKVIGFLVGQIMKKSRGKANPKVVNEIITKKLEL